MQGATGPARALLLPMVQPTDPDAPRDSIADVRALLDEALLALASVADARLPLREAERALADALTAVYRAQGAGGDAVTFGDAVLAARDAARAALEALMAVASEDDAAARGAALVAHAVRALGVVRYAPSELPVTLPREVRADARPASAPPPRASVEEPALLDVPRGLLRPVVALSELPPPPPPPPPEPPAPPPLPSPAVLRAQMEQLLAAAEAPEREPEPAPAPPAAPPPAPDARTAEERAERAVFGEAVPRTELVWDRARACVEDLAMLGLLRIPLDEAGQPWASRARSERRLLARIDALVACGVDAVLPRAVKLLETRPLPDPDLVWALAFALGSLAGDDALDACTRVLRAADLAEPAMFERVADALALAPHPGLGPFARRWLLEADPPRRAAAVRALARRGALFVEDAVRAAADPDVRVVREAARDLALASGQVHPFVFEPLLVHADEAVVRAALASATARRAEIGLRRARALLAQGHGAYADAALIVAVAGPAEASEALRAAAGAAVAPEDAVVTLTALGWFGDVAAVPLLLERLTPGVPPTVVAAAADALQRITGASLAPDAPQPEYAPDDRPFERAGFAEPPEVGPLSVDAAAWSEWWRRHGHLARAERRYRHGHAWGARDDVREMEHPNAAARDRRLAYLELVARTGTTLPFDPDAFVARQRRQLEALAAQLGTREGAVGAWPVRLAR